MGIQELLEQQSVLEAANIRLRQELDRYISRCNELEKRFDRMKGLDDRLEAKENLNEDMAYHNRALRKQNEQLRKKLGDGRKEPVTVQEWLDDQIWKQCASNIDCQDIKLLCEAYATLHLSDK